MSDEPRPSAAKPTDNERREVAARIREIMRKNPHVWLDVMVANAVCDVMGEGVVIGETVADLIDRPYGSAKATARMVERAAGDLSAGRRVSRVRSDEPGGGPCAAHVGE